MLYRGALRRFSFQPGRVASAEDVARPGVGGAAGAAAGGGVVQIEGAVGAAVSGGLVAGERIADAKYLHPIVQITFGCIAGDHARIALKVRSDGVVAIGGIA